MHGFFCSIGDSFSFDTSGFSTQMLRRHFCCDYFDIEHITTPKFKNDKLFVDTEQFFFAIEGIICNDEELLIQYDQSSLTDLIPYIYVHNGDKFFSEFRGSFCGVFYDKQNKKLTVYNDHIGDHMLFYTQIHGSILVSSDLKILNDGLKQMGIMPTINENSVRMMLGYGFLVLNNTLIEGVNRLGAGECLSIAVGCNPSYVVEQYHRFKYDFQKYSEQEAIEGIDFHFRNAVSRILKKNKQYGYDNYASLSAGLDSRMTTWVMRSMTDDKIYNITYSQKGYYDETVAKEIAQYLGNEMLFTPLDGGKHLYSELDNMLSITEGFVNYGGSAEALHVFSAYKNTNIGCLATGMIGDVVVNTYIKNQKENNSYSLNYGSITSKSSLLVDALPQDFYDRYSSKEFFFLYLRGFCCANMGTPVIIQPYAESYSPFIDVDFLNFIFKLPMAMRYNYNLYDKWILSKYPDAAFWRHNANSVVGKRSAKVSIYGRHMELKELPKRFCWFVLKKLHIVNMYKTTEGNSMSPEDTWIRSNQNLRDSLDVKFKENIWVLEQYPKLKKIVSSMYIDGVAIDKEIALTVVCSLSRLLK